MVKKEKPKKSAARTPESQVLEELREIEDRKMEADAEKRGARIITGQRGNHDKRTCRLYGCLQCKSEGVKNEKRGLK